MDIKRQEKPEPFPSVEDEVVSARDQEPHAHANRVSDESAPNPRPSIESATNRRSVESASDRQRRASTASINNSRTRATSIVNAFLSSNPPNGMWQATGEVAAKIPTFGEIRSGAFTHDGWTEEGQRERRGEAPLEIQRTRRSRASSASQGSRYRTGTTATPTNTTMVRHEEEDEYFPVTKIDSIGIPSPIREQPSTEPPRKPVEEIQVAEGSSSSDSAQRPIGPDETGAYPNGYRFPPKHTWQEATVIGLKAFWRFFLTPFGFVITLYGLNVVAWGAMIFFVLLKAAPAMCHPSCDALDSPRKKWIEIDSQILNGLFCVTGLGLIPWRFRDLYWLLAYRLFHHERSFRFLAGIHRSWFRLAGSQNLDINVGPAPLPPSKKSSTNTPHTSVQPANPLTPDQLYALESNSALPLPPTSIHQPPLTGIRAPPTATWKLDFVVWMYVFNTFLQGVLCGAMWGYNRYNRPSWLQAFAIVVACLVAIAAGLMVWKEGGKVKRIEGIPVHEEEVLRDIELGEENKEREKEQMEKVVIGAGGGHLEGKVVEVRIKKHKGRHWYERH